MEHENRAFKARLKTYRGTYTDNHINKISRARGVWAKIQTRVDKEMNYHIYANRSKRELPEGDIRLLMKKFDIDELFTPALTSVRAHSPSLLNITSNPASGISGKSLRTWMAERIELMRVRHYYLQFNVIPQSFTSFGETIDFSNLNASAEIPISDS